MSDRMSSPIDQDLPLEDPPRIDWHVAAPTLGLRWFIGVALLMPLLLAAGVYWLHHEPAGPGLRQSDSVVEVRIITVPDQVPQQEASQPPVQTQARQADPLIDDTVRSIPEDVVAPRQSEPERVSPPAARSARTSPAAPARTSPSPMTAIFQRTLQSHIARYRHYPDQARRDRVQGTVQLVFAMRRDGIVTDVWVKASSGDSALDLAAVETIRNAQPLPRIPAELPGQLNVSMPVAFNLP